MSDALDWKKVVEGLMTRVNVLEAEVSAIKVAADKSAAYMEVVSKLAERNHELRCRTE